MSAEEALICSAGGVICAFPIGCVAETMRPLEVAPLAAMPPFLLGMSIIRGLPTPVIDLARLLGLELRQEPTRFVTLKTGERQVAVAVEAVLGVRVLIGVAELPPLLRSNELISAIGAADRQLYLVLEAGRVVPESLWAALQAVPE